jgi:hypothetical protein
MTQTKSIRAKCLDCSNTSDGVSECQETECSLYLLRFGKRPSGCRPLKAIKEYCNWCTNNMKDERLECPVINCPLHTYRFGKKIIAINERSVQSNPPEILETSIVGA